MADKHNQDEQVKNVSGGQHRGGTHFGQAPGDAKEKAGDNAAAKGDKARSNDGKTS